MTFSVHSRHLCRFSANQSTFRLLAPFSNTLDNCSSYVDVKSATSIVIQEVQGLRALHQQIIHRHSYKINTNKVMDACVDCKPKLRANAICSTYQDGILVPCRLDVEEPTKSTKFGVRSGPFGRFYERFNSFNQCVTSIDRDASLSVC